MPHQAIEAMIRFEERYGGLWYPLLGSNGMEHGLDGEATVYPSIDGWGFAGILDGDQTWTVDVLLDERTVLMLAGQPRIINSSMLQRLECHAQLAQVRGWPHVTLGLATEPGQEPGVAEAHLPSPDGEATGPADKWWGDDETVIHLELHKWWGDVDIRVARCFTRRADDLPAAVESVRRAVTGGVWRDEDWCGLCSHFRLPEQPCLPNAVQRHA
ncbi:hypothetical protein [Streptomyces sp. NPDC085540]|uniref:hypothetical protein n=1 Tax=Streptomyces sp. NPDC085540 TaxID=3365730 RepID=UPI0037CF239B